LTTHFRLSNLRNDCAVETRTLTVPRCGEQRDDRAPLSAGALLHGPAHQMAEVPTARLSLGGGILGSIWGTHPDLHSIATNVVIFQLMSESDNAGIVKSLMYGPASPLFTSQTSSLDSPHGPARSSPPAPTQCFHGMRYFHCHLEEKGGIPRAGVGQEPYMDGFEIFRYRKKWGRYLCPEIPDADRFLNYSLDHPVELQSVHKIAAAPATRHGCTCLYPCIP